MKNVEIPNWLEKLPWAPEFRPTDTEFADPIAYISKIEKEASAFGICKVIPPLPKPSRKYVLHNLNKSLSKCPELGSDVNLVTSPKTDSSDRTVGSGESRAVFTTRHQELGCEKIKKAKGTTVDHVVGAKKQVWQSGEVYTLEQFEAKSKTFAKSQLSTVKEVNPLVIESMFWKQALEKPIYIEYANDVPGSGFGEPEGMLRYVDRRRRKTRKRNSFDRNSFSNSDKKNDEVDTKSSVRGDTNRNVCTETKSNDGASCSGRKEFQGSAEVEGSAGWKLSNSPWNLQVIARSPGSLTRFMPDDIPGVTSPMVYIGMLFSWFAWHVEDHELHSLNFLHIGSPKTWYSVPGDCAFDFEEAIRLHAYGGNADRLGEKTTVLSPEIFVASGIPCCRLVQYPGEFVVTFPRAYHIGFSHGFNCGEAANFGTPKWLTIAKEAAVRRAVMNYLPMLSHQQLMYLLTMSFISRIPRSLLPGVRSSRLRDRQKEEREILVKRAFIEDILHENRLVNILLRRSSSYRAVLWDVKSVSSSSKESGICKDADPVVVVTSASMEKDSPGDNSIMGDVKNQLSDYIGAVGYDINDDDLAYDFQIESGTLPCVACGILGFPFMAVVQPFVDPLAVSVGPTLKHEDVSSEMDIAEGWNISNVSLKPRIFCLEHAIEIEELLSSKGGSNVLVICHSDFQKIKTHAAVVAEEISMPFCYVEIAPLVNASPENLNLIDIAIGREETECAEDWTSQLSINLQHCVKVKKCFPSKNVQHLSSLNGLFCDATPRISNKSSVKWLSTKLRTKSRQLKPLLKNKPSVESETAEEVTEREEEQKISEKIVEKKFIQYSRKRYKARVVEREILGAQIENPDKEDKIVEVNILSRVDNSVEIADVGLTSAENLIDCATTVKTTLGQEEEATMDESVASDDVAVHECGIPSDGYEDAVKEASRSGGSSSNVSVSEGQQCIQTGEAISRNTAITNESTIEEVSFSPKNKISDNSKATAKSGSTKRKRKTALEPDQEDRFDVFIKSPCEGLRPRATTTTTTTIVTENKNKKPTSKKLKTAASKKERQTGRYKCELDGCIMSFETKGELALHKGNKCPVEGCGKKFNSHKYAVQHKRVHDDDRPLKCSWEGCKMTFKWAWARTEHLRVHTGEKPYLCKVEGCGLAFRFVSDFSRHRRKTGHYVGTSE
ncbi:hypothetical protein ABFS82_06G165900 [Erythranthe guttata]